jgi:ABC-type amino acid transport substrate-binding protein
MRGAMCAAAVVVFTLSMMSSAYAQDALRVCLNENLPPASLHRGGKGSGFDMAVAEAVAQRLGRTLTVQWFESELDEDASATLEANAMLSDGKCQLVGGYPLIKHALGRPAVPTATLPDLAGPPPADRRRRVELGELVPSAPYRYAPLTVVVNGGVVSKRVTKLDDLKGVRLGAEAGSLPDTVLMLFADGRLVEQIHHIMAGRDELLGQLEQGVYDATLVDLRRFDAYRAAHPDTKIKATGYYYRIGFNMGFVGLATDAALIAHVNAAIGDITAKGELPPLAQAAGLTYLPAREPHVGGDISLSDLQRK